jgi:hypothetical protein
MEPKIGFPRAVSLFLGLVMAPIALCPAEAQSTPRYEVDPTWLQTVARELGHRPGERRLRGRSGSCVYRQ